MKVGDRVKYDMLDTGKEELGTIVGIREEGSIAVRFDNDVDGHDLDPPYRCKIGYGWYCDETDLKLISKRCNCSPICKECLKDIRELLTF